MSNFKEQLEADLGTFVNDEEFAELHTVNGIEVSCVLEGLTTKEMLTKANNTPSYDGISGTTRILHIRTADMQERVTHGNAVDVDGEMYRVGNVVEDMGLTTITLEADSL